MIGALLIVGGCVGFIAGIVYGVNWERRSAHEAWGAPGTLEPRSLSQSAVLESIRAEFEYPRPRSCAGRSRVSVDREGIASYSTLSDFGRFAGEAET